MAVELHAGDLPASLRFGDTVAVDTETMGLNPLRDRLCLVQLSAGDGQAPIAETWISRRTPEVAAKRARRAAPSSWTEANRCRPRFTAPRSRLG